MTGPLIAVVGKPLPADKVSGWAREGVGVPAPYIEALHRAGGQEAVLYPVELDEDGAAERLARFDGLLLIGGGDVDPAHYGEDARPEVYDVDPVRDGFEVALARAAVARDVPTLAICRGAQVLNVALGGTLDQHLPATGRPVLHRDPAGHPVSHSVRLEPGSLVAKATGVEKVDAASHHHQAPARVGANLRAVGWAEDGVVEALELDHGWVVGVQWHPEETCRLDPAQQGLFETLVGEASRTA